jgi:hypothetical protein
MPASPVFHGLDVCSAIPDGVPLWLDGVSMTLDGVPLKLDGVSLTLDSVPQTLDAVSMLSDRVSPVPDAVSVLSDRVSPVSDAVSGTADGFPAGQRRILRWPSCFCIKTTNQSSQLMKKSICLAASLLALNLTPVFGQPNGMPPSGPNYVPRLNTIVLQANGSPQNEPPALTKFNLDFPGGTPKELVAAIEKAMGKPLNAIIPTEDADLQMPPLKMNDVVVPQLFAALEATSRKTVAVSTGTFGNSYSTFTGDYGFKTADSPLTDASIWYFHAEKPSLPPLVSTQKICQFYALTPYLDKGFTVDDITTAIQTGWKMAGETVTPELNYHKETKLLIAFGEPNKLQTIQQVLQTLPTVKNDYWQQMNQNLFQVQQQVKELEKRVSASSTNAAPAEKSGK